MRGDYASDRAWADQFDDQVKAIIRMLVVQPATVERDRRQATDLMVYRITNGPRKGQPVGDIAVRLRDETFWIKEVRPHREPVSWGLQFTIRSDRDSGAETELSKIKHGFGDWFIYGHVEQRLVRHWMTLDLEIFRQHEDGVAFRPIDNPDGTHGRAYNVLSFPETIRVAVSDTMAIALEKGVDAVERLSDQPEKKFWHVCPICGLAGPAEKADDFYCHQHGQISAESLRDDLTVIERVLGYKILKEPPNLLHDWIRRFGGYAKITIEGWADYNEAIAQWREATRQPPRRLGEIAGDILADLQAKREKPP